MKIIKTNNLKEGDCILLPRYIIHIDGKDYHSYLCMGNTFDEGIEYFMKHWGTNPRHKPMRSIEILYNLIKRENLEILSRCC